MFTRIKSWSGMQLFPKWKLFNKKVAFTLLIAESKPETRDDGESDYQFDQWQ